MKNILCENESYIVYNEYEAAYIKIKSSGRVIPLGEFYGDPYGATFSSDLKYLAVYGCGAEVYSIDKRNCRKISELLRDENLWFVYAEPTDENSFELLTENGSRYILLCRKKRSCLQ